MSENDGVDVTYLVGGSLFLDELPEKPVDQEREIRFAGFIASLGTNHIYRHMDVLERRAARMRPPAPEAESGGNEVTSELANKAFVALVAADMRTLLDDIASKKERRKSRSFDFRSEQLGRFVSRRVKVMLDEAMRMRLSPEKPFQTSNAALWEVAEKAFQNPLLVLDLENKCRALFGLEPLVANESGRAL